MSTTISVCKDERYWKKTDIKLCTVVLSFLPYTTGKQQLDEEMPQIRHFHFINRYQRDNRFTTYYVFGQSYTTYYTSGQLSWGVFIIWESRMELDIN